MAWTAALAVAVAAIIALAIPTVRHLRETPPPTPPETRVDIVTPPTTNPTAFALSPDGRRLVFVASGDGPSRLWLQPLEIVTAQPLAGTDGAGSPFWSPDGSRIVYQHAGRFKLYQKPSSGAGRETPLVEFTQPIAATSWSRDGRFLLYDSVDPTTRFDVWVLPMQGDPKPWTFLHTTFNEREAQFSPDGRWVAYESDESGRFQICVRPFTGPGEASSAAAGPGTPGGQWQVSRRRAASTRGGGQTAGRCTTWRLMAR